jgi:hypothetical protein
MSDKSYAADPRQEYGGRKGNPNEKSIYQR